MQLGAADLGREPRPRQSAPVKPEAGGVDQISGLGQGAAQSAVGPRDHQRQQIGEQFARPFAVGIGQGRALRQLGAEVVKPDRLARHPGDDLAQARRSGQLRVDHRDQLAFRRQPANPPIGAAHLDQSFKLAPRYLLQHLVKHAIVMPHGIAPRVRIVGQTSRTEWNQCHAPCPVKLNRTALWTSPVTAVL